MSHKLIIADTKKCIGCLSCELACAAANAKISFEEAYTTKLPLVSRNRVVKVDTKTAPIQCMHCEDPSCVKLCPVGALRFDRDTIQLNEKICIGCKMCMMVCPFGAIKLVEHEGRVFAQKCNLCLDHPEGPSCIRVCTTDAISIVDYDTFKAKMAEKEKSLHA